LTSDHPDIHDKFPFLPPKGSEMSALIRQFNWHKSTHGDPDFWPKSFNMPIMGGLECLSELKKKESMKNIPVLMYSTSSNKSDSQRAKQLGALCFVIKPDEYSHLKKIIRTVLTHLETGMIDTLCDAVHRI
jgi:PleD family two-component response regulator